MIWNINRPDLERLPSIQERIATRIKPPGALGKLEQLATQLAMVQGEERITISRPQLLLFAADHGIVEEGVSIAPAEVSAIMTQAFLNGQAAVNVFCKTVDMRLEVIDAGLKKPLDPRPDHLIERRAGHGTENLAHQSAMTPLQVQDCLEWGADRARHHIRQGSNVLAIGEMGIGNTSSAAALMASLLNLPAKQCVGRGSGLNDDQLTLKQALIEKALLRCDSEDALRLLEEYGGFEIAQMTGAILGGAESGVVVVVDGFIATVAAALAQRIAPASRYYQIFAHQSAEKGHALLLEEIEASPLLDLDMRLGEGTGAVLALPLLRAAAAFYNDMASFEDLGIPL